jgi:basic amino acid/polyamine antiporter, APA family
MDMATPVRTRSHLLRIVGVGFGIAVSVGATVGSGILRTPGEVVAHWGSLWPIYALWLLGGVYTLLSSSSLLELGTTFPDAGGWYVYSRRAFGDYGGFLVGCCDWMVEVVATAYLAVALAEFASGLQPALAARVKLVALTSLGALGLLNWLGLRTGSRTQELTSLVKALTFVALVLACFRFPTPAQSPPSPVPPTSVGPTESILLAFVLSMQAVLITYDGWYAPIYFTEEDKNPDRNLPRSMIGGVLSSAAIFLLVNAALLHVVPIGQLAGSQVPATDAAMVVFGSYGKQIILIISVITVLSTINATLLMGPRIIFGMGRDGLAPRWAASVNAGGTPSVGLLLTILTSTVLILSGSFETLIAIASFFMLAVHTSGFSALLILRRRRPDLPRPYKVWFYPWTPLAVLVVSGVLFLVFAIGDPKHSLVTFLLIVLSYPVYVVAVKKGLRHSTISSTSKRPGD